MDFKWLKTAMLYETPDGGGGGGGEPASTGGEPGGVEPPAPSGGDGGEPAPPPPPQGVPQDIKTLFEPPAPPPPGYRQEPRGDWDEPPVPPGRGQEPPKPVELPELPSEDDWVERPARAMKMMQEWTEAVVEQKTGGLRQTVDQQRETIEQLRRLETSRLAKGFADSMRGAYDGINKHYKTIFTKDDGILRNPEARGMLDDLVHRYTNDAIEHARATGDYGRLQYIATPEFARRALNLVKGEATSTARLDVEGAATVSPQGTPPPRADGLSAEFAAAVAAARAEGWNIDTEKVKAALKKRPPSQVE